LLPIQKTTRRHIPEDSKVHSYHCGVCVSQKIYFFNTNRTNCNHAVPSQ